MTEWKLLARTISLVLILAKLEFIDVCRSDEIMDILSPFIDLEELANQASNGVPGDGVATKPVYQTYPLASSEMDALMQMYRDCRTQESAVMRTWCIGDDDSHSDEGEVLCPRGVTTHPCTGRVLHVNKSFKEDMMEFLWPWEGLRCDAFTDPTTVTHIYLPREFLNCDLASLDLSVMVALEQLDLSRNNLYGRFPGWLGEMTMLRLLNLGDNHLTGDILSSFADNDALELINLSGNGLTASTLDFFDAFHQLQNLDLSDNKIALELPRNLFASKFLRNVNISHNEFQGDLPKLPVFQFLESFDISSNLLTGTIPPQLSLWGREDPHDPDENSSLVFFNVSNNIFAGNLPVISNQSAMQRFDVHSNSFGGLIPEFPLSLLQFVKPADFDGNAFLCSMPSVLLRSNLSCFCGDGYAINSTGQTSRQELTDSRDKWRHMVPASEGDDLCAPCPEGSYSNATTHQKCRPCPAGSTPDTTSNKRARSCGFCLPGTFANDSGLRSCTPCLPGTFAAGVGATSCDSCNPGYFAAEQGSTNCTMCAAGTFSNTKGAIMCTSCPVGTYANAEGEAECLMCPKGAYQDVIKSVECKVCPVGHIAPQQGHAKCTPCSPGSFYDVKTRTCILCRPGTFSGVAAQTECSKCENGTVAEVFGEDKCLGVAAPGFGYKTLATAVKCDPGTFNNGMWRTCQPCTSGTFASTSGSRKCSSCPKGSFASSKGSASCEKAPPGSFVQFKGATRAEPCPPNHIAAVNGRIMCTPCQTPSFSFLPGGIECSLAKPGEVYEYVEWPRLALSLVGVEQQNLPDAKDELESPIDALAQAWADTLTSYSDSTYHLHMLQVFSSSTQLTQIIVAAELTTTLSSKAQADNSLQKDVRDTVHQAAEAAESALEDLFDELNGSNSRKERDKSKTDQLADLVQSKSFQEALVRQFGRRNLFDGALLFSMINVSIVEPPFKSTRAVACTPGTFFSVTSEKERVCLPCEMGSYSSTSNALNCEPCPRGTFAAKEGLEMCKSCPSGADAVPGASSCVECSWFTYECEGFWQDLIAAVCLGAALLRIIYKKIRKLCVGDQAAQQQDESVALMTAVRTHGRTFDGAQYAPMGTVSVDTMFGDDKKSC